MLLSGHKEGCRCLECSNEMKAHKQWSKPLWNARAYRNVDGEIPLLDQLTASRDNNKLAERMMKAIDSMAGRKKEILRLILLDKSFNEIASILNLSKGTVQTYYNRSIKELKALLSSEDTNNE